MKKKFLCLLLSLCLLVSAMPMTALAASKGPAIRGVDYSRIDEGRSSVTATGTLSFGGYAVPCYFEAGNGASRPEVNKVIRRVMAEQKISSKFLIEADAVVKKAASQYGLSGAEIMEALGGTYSEIRGHVVMLTGSDAGADTRGLGRVCGKRRARRAHRSTGKGLRGIRGHRLGELLGG